MTNEERWAIVAAMSTRDRWQYYLRGTTHIGIACAAGFVAGKVVAYILDLIEEVVW